MTTIHMTPGATVIVESHHRGIERMTAGLGLVARMVGRAVEALDTWRIARVDAHNDAMMVELAAHDPRVLAELRAAYTRADA